MTAGTTSNVDPEGMTPEEELQYRLNCIRNLNPTTMEVSQYKLKHLWQIVSKSLWTTNYKDFDDFVNEQIIPYLETEESDIAPDTLKDLARVAKRTLPYSINHHVSDKKGQVITPDYLIDVVGVNKLKITSSKFEDDTKLTVRERNTLLFDLTILTVSELQKKYTQPLIPPIPIDLHWNPDGTADIIMNRLSVDQVNRVKKALT